MMKHRDLIITPGDFTYGQDNDENGWGCLKISWINFPVDGH
jgi:hypothetical protein